MEKDNLRAVVLSASIGIGRQIGAETIICIQEKQVFTPGMIHPMITGNACKLVLLLMLQ